MSKLYKDLKYDTDWVMQPGDPLTSSDGSTAIKAVNTGKGFIETYGDVIDHYYDVTVDIPQVSGASARIRLKDVDDTSIGVEILSIDGFPGAEIDNNTLSHIKLNGASWGYVNCSPAWEGETYPDYTIIPIGFGGRICVKVSPEYADSEYCHWSDLEQTRQLLSSKEISTTDQLPSLPLSVANGGTGVNGSSQSANKVLASPSSGTGAISFRSLVASDIPDLNTSKLTSGTLGVARGGTGKGTHTVNSVIIGGTSTTGALQNVAAASGAFYSTGTNVRPQFGTLPVTQGGTGATSASAARTNLEITAANIPFENNQTVGAAIRDLYDTTAWVDNDVLKVGATEIATLKLANNKTVATTDQLLQIGTTSTTAAAGDHTHSSLKNGNYTASLPTLTANKTLAITDDLNILPITTSTALSITMTADKYMYKVTDSGATGTFPTLTAPTGLPASCYYKFEMEWVTASPTATYAQTASTTPAMKWISSPVMQTDGLTHTYHISGRYDTTTSTFWMSCWKIDDAQGTITPDAHTLKYLLTTPTQTTSTTTDANDTITVQLSDHAINTVNVPVSVTNVVLKFPGQAVGKARDFFVRLIVTGSTVPSITLTEPDGSAIDFDVDDDSWTEIEQGVNLLMFTETAQ